MDSQMAHTTKGIIVSALNESNEVFNDNTANQIAFAVSVARKQNIILYFDVKDIPLDPCAPYHDIISVPPEAVNPGVTPGNSAICILTRDNPDNQAIAHLRFHWGDPFWVHMYVTYASTGNPSVYVTLSEDPNWFIEELSELYVRLQHFQNPPATSGATPPPLPPINQSWKTDSIRPDADPEDIYFAEYGFYLQEASGKLGVFCHLNVQYAPLDSAFSIDIKNRMLVQQKKKLERDTDAKNKSRASKASKKRQKRNLTCS